MRDFHYLDLDHLSRDSSVPVTLTADTGQESLSTWRGRIVRSEGIIDQTSRVVYVVAQVDKPYEVADLHPEPLLIGTFVSAQIEGRDGRKRVRRSTSRHIRRQYSMDSRCE